jgi:ABC-type transport system substrate-binding protein
VKGGIVRQRAQRDPSSFDPHTATSSRDNITNAKLYSSLFINNRGSEFECNVCERYELEEGGKVWVFHLRKNVKFSKDGKLLTTADVKYSLRKIMGLVDGIVSPRSGWLKEYVDVEVGDGDGIEIIDDFTFKLHLIRPAPVLPILLGTGFPGMVREGATREQLRHEPDGTGPWMIKDWVRGSIMKLKPNPYYFKEGRPYPDEWHMIYIRGNRAASAAFLTNKVDIKREDIPIDDLPMYERMAKEGKIFHVEKPAGCRPQGVNMNSTAPPFDNLKLRQAVNLALDRKSYIEVVHDGHAAPALVFVLDSEWGRPSEEVWNKLPGWGTGEKKKQELEEAKKLLAEAGYPDGLEVEMIARSSGKYPRQVEYIAGELKKVGIKANIKLMDSPELFPRVKELRYAIWPYWFCQTTLDPDEMWGSYFVTGGSRNWLGYSNPEVDKLFIQQSSELDPVKRKQLNRQLEDIILRDLPFAPLADHNTYYDWFWYIKGWADNHQFYTYESQDDAWVVPH